LSALIKTSTSGVLSIPFTVETSLPSTAVRVLEAVSQVTSPEAFVVKTVLFSPFSILAGVTAAPLIFAVSTRS
jgi:hypothetical protein